MLTLRKEEKTIQPIVETKTSILELGKYNRISVYKVNPVARHFCWHIIIILHWSLGDVSSDH